MSMFGDVMNNVAIDRKAWFRHDGIKKTTLLWAMMAGLLGVVLLGMATLAVAADMLEHQRGGATPKHHDRNLIPQPCGPSPNAQPPAGGTPLQMSFEGVQIETSDIKLYEVFFEQILDAQPLFRIDHPQVDHLRGYCYRDMQIVVRQDLRTPRPTGWVQINFAVPDAEAVKEGLERAVQSSPLAQRDETERLKVVRIRLKPDVPRSNCRVVRLEVSGPEGFMIGFNQYKEGTCMEKKEENMARKG